MNPEQYEEDLLCALGLAYLMAMYTFVFNVLVLHTTVSFFYIVAVMEFFSFLYVQRCYRDLDDEPTKQKPLVY